MPYRKRRFLWPAVLLIAAGTAFAWWVLRPIAQRHVQRRPHAIARIVPAPSPSPPPPFIPPASPAPAPSSRARGDLAIIIDDAGQWLHTERAFIALPIPLTLSVLPDVRYTHLISDEAAAAGKGVMLHLPMEPISEINPGPGKITTEMSDKQIVEQTDADIADVPLAQGVNNHEGSKATADSRVMRDVASAIASHGSLFFVDSLTIGDSVAAATTQAAGIPTARRDVFLDDEANVSYVERQLSAAASVALTAGRAIAIGHPRPTTLEALRAMIPRLKAEGIHFVLVRDLITGEPQPSASSASHG